MEQKIFKSTKEIRDWWDTDEGSQYSFSSLLSYVDKSIGECPMRPNKPYLSQKHTANMATEYAKELVFYENELLPEYQIKLKEFNELRNSNAELIVELMKDESGFNDIIPSQYQDKVYSYAYQQSHSGGFSEVNNILLDLVAIFE